MKYKERKGMEEGEEEERQKIGYFRNQLRSREGEKERQRKIEKK